MSEKLLSDLRKMQETFGEWLMDGSNPLRRGREGKQAMRAAIVSHGELPAEARVAIYWRMYRARTIGALQEDFSLVEAVLGEEPFENLAKDYVAAHPSRSHTLSHLGRDFAAFVANHPSFERRDALADLARFEWALVEAFHQAKTPPQDEERLAAIPAQDLLQLQLLLAPSARRLRFEHQVSAHWRRHCDGEELIGVWPEEAPEEVVVYRRGNKSAYLSLTGEEGAFFAALADGATIEAAIESIASRLATMEDCSKILQATSHWLRDGLFYPS